MKIKIINYDGYNGGSFANIKNGTIHEVVRKVFGGWIIKKLDGVEIIIMQYEAEEIKDE